MTQSRLVLACATTFLSTVVVLGDRHSAQPAAGAVETQDGNLDLFNENLVRTFIFRNVGPFRMQARASAIAVPNGPPKSISTRSTSRPGPAACSRPPTVA